MDMERYTKKSQNSSWKLLRHLRAIRENQLVVAEIFLFLAEDPPNVEGAVEAFESLDKKDQIAIWSCSTRDGGVWERWQRDALKYRELTDAWRIYCERKGIPFDNEISERM
jgi:hypothetical protein